MMNLSANDPRALALIAAIHAGDVQTLAGHLRDSPDLAAARVIDALGVSRTLLLIAADWPGHFPNGADTVATLAAAGADVNACVIHPGRNGAPETALHWAASSDDVEVIDALLDAGADIEAPGAVFTGGTPMSDAVVFAQWRAARRLFERGATTTIWQASALGLLDRVRDFWSQDPGPIPAEITNAFWNACRGGQQEVAAFLLERGAGLNWVGHDHKTPYDMAHESGDPRLIAWLSAQGAKRRADLETPNGGPSL